jgi:serine/threonine-protein kinase
VERSVGDARIGTELGGFQLVRLLGKGGMGAVYEALEPATGRRVALKLLLKEAVGSDPTQVSRFEREGQAAARVVHAHVAQLHTLGRDMRTGELYLVTELLEGGSLATKLERGPLPWREAATLGAQIARGLEAIHAAGLVHRDLKPANVLLDEQGRAKIADFGLARLADANAQRLTRTGEMLGTPEFLAPEQVDAAKTAGPPADVYALGATIHALVTGAPPFAGNSHELIVKTLMNAPPRLGSLVPGVPRAFEELVLRLLSKRPEERLRADDAARELEEIARSPEAAPRSRAPLAVVGVGLVLVAAAAAIAVARRTPEPAPAPGASPSPSSDLPAGAYPWWRDVPERERPKLPLPRGLQYSEKPREYVNKVDGSVLVFVPGGTFKMGSAEAARRLRAIRHTDSLPCEPEREVTLSPYFVGKLEVTVKQFRRFVNETRYKTTAEVKGEGHVFYEPPADVSTHKAPNCSWSQPNGRTWAADDEPVVQVSWDDAQEYVRWAGLRLPTEAQWEKAALWGPDAKKARLYAWGDDEPSSGHPVANLKDISCMVGRERKNSWFEGYQDGFPDRAPVGSFKLGVSLYGALDMSGNAAEWCLDGSEGATFPEGSVDTLGDAMLPSHIYRGGSCYDRRPTLLGAVRLRNKAEWSTDDLGFRVARTY